MNSSERDRYRELLEELRTILPGVQVLLGFLLTVPFATRFPELSTLGRVLFGVAVCCAALATILLIAPASYHRLVRSADEGAPDRRQRLQFATAATVLGLAALAVSIISAMLLVMHFVFRGTLAVAISGGLAVALALAWYAVPLLRRRSRRRSE